MAQRALENLEGGLIQRPADAQGQPRKTFNMTDSRYLSDETVRELKDLPLDPYKATSRQRHHDKNSAEAAARLKRH